MLAFLSSGGDSLHAYPEYARLVRDGARLRRAGREIARRHRMSIGTIVSDAQIVVQLSPRRRARLGRGVVRRAAHAGRSVRLRRHAAGVRARARHEGVGATRAEHEGRDSALDGESAAAVRRARGPAARAARRSGRSGIFRDAEMEAVRPLLELQAKWSAMPKPNELLIEHVKTREDGTSSSIPFEGRLVHEGLAALLAYRIARLAPDHVLDVVERLRLRAPVAEEPPLEEALAARACSRPRISSRTFPRRSTRRRWRSDNFARSRAWPGSCFPAFRARARRRDSCRRRADCSSMCSGVRSRRTCC